MNSNHSFAIALSVSLILSIGTLTTGCFPSTTAVALHPHSLPDSTESYRETKVFTKDGSVYLFGDGFAIIRRHLEGIASKYTAKGTYQNSSVSLDLDEIVAATIYQNRENAGTVLGDLLGVLYTPILPMGIYCLACPKCCFGSCPTIYTPMQGGWGLETECFSSSVSKLLEKPDLNRLNALPDSNGFFKLKITNEALETHYINQFTLVAGHHPIGTTMLPTDLGSYVAVRDLVSPAHAINAKGVNVLSQVTTKDSNWYRSGSEMVEAFPTSLQFDWIDFDMRVPRGKEQVTVVLRQRNTLLSTTLFYDIVLGSQGINALQWTTRMNTDTAYAARFNKVYKMFSGLTLQIKRNGVWRDQAYFEDAGPLTWKEIATSIHVTPDDSLLNLRLKFFPDNVMIDQIAYCFDADRNLISTKEIPLDSAVENSSLSRRDMGRLLASADSLYLVTNPGESYTLNYHVAKDTSEQATTLFIQSQGYYTEWLRGNWIRQPESSESAFDLYDVPKTLRMLATSWHQNREEIERVFFETRIPLREKL